ncbi:MAG: hypothetical protein O2894_03595 [Planctomycetota bacterium]|nr:hypothetical protein [Planctomycetota bacterium]
MISVRILFTGVDNTPARRCYEGLGYEAVGRYGLVLFVDREPVA